MPLKLEKSDRRLLLWAAAVLVPLVILLAVLSSGAEESLIPSTYSPQSHGAKAAYLLLKERGYDVERWEKSPADLPPNPVNTVLVLAVPLAAPTQDEKNELMTFVGQGGRIVAIGPTASMFLPKQQIEPQLAPSPEWQEFQPEILSSITRGGTITMSPGGYWKDSSTAYLVHYSDNGRPIVVSYTIGKGEVVWWAGSTPLTNIGISRAGNLALLLNSVEVEKPRRILWDEYFHASHRTFAGYMAERPLRYGLLQCGLVVLALLLTFSRRNTPVYPLGDPPRLSPLEFVHTLGGLYRRAKANHAALEVLYGRFRALATRKLGLPPGTSADNLARALRNRMGYKDESLPELMKSVEAALRQAELREERALQLAQELNRHMLNLKLIGNA
jgi:hypothetical protein